MIVPHPHFLQKTSPLHPAPSRQEDPLNTRVSIRAHIRSTICYGLPLSTREVITPGNPAVAMKASSALCGLLFCNLHTIDQHVTKSTVPQASSPELRQFEKLLLCDEFPHIPQEPRGFSNLVFLDCILVAKGADLILSEKVTGWIATEKNLFCPGTVSCD